MNRKKKLAFFLVLVMLLVTAIPISPAVTALAAQKNSITELGIKNLPESNTLKVGDIYNFDPLIIQTELGKGKTTGVVWWEVNSSTNTAGVVSSRWGYVYPVYAGSFEIRALAFPDTASLNAWKKNKTAGAKYITDLTDWVTITVTSDKEGYALARTQSQLNSALANRNCTDIHIETDKEVTFTIKAANYQKKTLTVNAPNVEVDNSARFKEIIIEQIKESTFTERGKSNSFFIKAPNARLVVEKASRVASVIFAPESEAESPKLNIFGNGGYIANVSIATKGEVNLQGEILAPVPVVVEETAAGAKVEIGLPAKIDVKADAVIETTKEAVQSIINLLAPKISVSIAGDSAENVRVNIDKDAADTTVTTSVSVEIIAKADAKIEADKGAEDIVIRQDADVKVETTNNTEKEIISTDLEGNNFSTIKPGESASIAVPTTVPTVAPTETPFIPSTPSTPSTPVTPNPTPSETLAPEATPTPEPSGEPETTPTPEITPTPDVTESPTPSIPETTEIPEFSGYFKCWFEDGEYIHNSTMQIAQGSNKDIDLPKEWIGKTLLFGLDGANDEDYYELIVLPSNSNAIELTDAPETIVNLYVIPKGAEKDSEPLYECTVTLKMEQYDPELFSKMFSGWFLVKAGEEERLYGSNMPVDATYSSGSGGMGYDNLLDSGKEVSFDLRDCDKENFELKYYSPFPMILQESKGIPVFITVNRKGYETIYFRTFNISMSGIVSGGSKPSTVTPSAITVQMEGKMVDQSKGISNIGGGSVYGNILVPIVRTIYFDDTEVPYRKYNLTANITLKEDIDLTDIVYTWYEADSPFDPGRELAKTNENQYEVTAEHDFKCYYVEVTYKDTNGDSITVSSRKY